MDSQRDSSKQTQRQEDLVRQGDRDTDKETFRDTVRRQEGRVTSVLDKILRSVSLHVRQKEPLHQKPEDNTDFMHIHKTSCNIVAVVVFIIWTYMLSDAIQKVELVPVIGMESLSKLKPKHNDSGKQCFIQI